MQLYPHPHRSSAGLNGSVMRASGFSLMELLVGMVLGLIVVSGAVAIYLASSRSYSEVEEFAQLSENMRFAETVLTDGLRHAGFVGEVNPASIDVTGVAAVADCTGNASVYNLAFPLFAVVADADGKTTPDIGDACIDDAVELTDVLIIKSVIPQPISNGPREDAPTTIADYKDGELEFGGTLETGKIYVLSNFDSGMLFDTDDAHPVTVPGGARHPSISTGGTMPGGIAWEYRFEIFYVRQDADDGDPDTPPPTPWLARKVLRQSAGGVMEVVTEDLVRDVENLKVRFGIDSDNDGELDTYTQVSDMTAGDWTNIVAMEVAMLVSSQADDVNYEDDKTYDLLGVDVTATAGRERRRRVVAQSYVSVRNMKFIIRG